MLKQLTKIKTTCQRCKSMPHQASPFLVGQSTRCPCSSESERLEQEVAVCMLQAVVPEELPVVEGYLPAPRHHQLHHRVKVSKETKGVNMLKEWTRSTYRFPVLTLLGLMSLALKLAKKSSHGAAA